MQDCMALLTAFSNPIFKGVKNILQYIFEPEHKSYIFMYIENQHHEPTIFITYFKDLKKFINTYHKVICKH